MAAIQFGTNFAGTQPDEEDRRGMNWQIEQSNISRVEQGLEPLPDSTAAERNQSYQTIMAEFALARHLENIMAAGDKVLLKDLAPRFKISTNAQRTAALNALAPLQ